MSNLSTGDPATLGSYLKLSIIVYGEESNAVKFLKDKIKNSPEGEHEEVIADESQMIVALTTIHLGPKEKR